MPSRKACVIVWECDDVTECLYLQHHVGQPVKFTRLPREKFVAVNHGNRHSPKWHVYHAESGLCVTRSPGYSRQMAVNAVTDRIIREGVRKLRSQIYTMERKRLTYTINLIDPEF